MTLYHDLYMHCIYFNFVVHVLKIYNRNCRFLIFNVGNTVCQNIIFIEKGNVNCDGRYSIKYLIMAGMFFQTICASYVVLILFLRCQRRRQLYGMGWPSNSAEKRPTATKNLGFNNSMSVSY